MGSRTTKPYVDALFEVAASPDAVEDLLPGLLELSRTLDESEELRAVLRDPGVDRKTKGALLADLLSRLRLPDLGRRFAEVLLGNRRILVVGEVVAALRERLDEVRHVVEAHVRTAAPLDAAGEEALRKALEARTAFGVRLRTEVDPTLLGGFVVRVGSEVFDASIAHRLERARRTIAAAAAG
jgi:F-type H+-transporting ATPase subunit delta